MKRSLGILALVLSLSSWTATLAERPGQLVSKLHSKTPSELTDAVTSLRKMGSKARPALEGYLDPSRSSYEPAAKAEQREQISRLVTLLGHRSYRKRQKAKRELIRIGYRASHQLAVARKQGSLQVRRTAQQLLQLMYPPSPEGAAGVNSRVRACLLLAFVGGRDSLPTLMHVMEKDNPLAAGAAAFAIRSILCGGPTYALDEWLNKRARPMAAWKQLVSRVGRLRLDPTAGQTDLALGLTKGLTLSSRSVIRETLQYQRWGIKERLVRSDDARFETRIVSLEPLQLIRHYLMHAARKISDENGRSKQQNWSWASKRITLKCDALGRMKPDVARGDLRRFSVGGMPMLMPMGTLLALDLPRGTFRTGQRRALRGAAGLRAMFSLSGMPNDTAGQLTYLGRIGKLDQFFVTLTGQIPQRRSGVTSRIYLHGRLQIDPTEKRLVSYRLDGLSEEGFSGRRGQDLLYLRNISLVWQLETAGATQRPSTGDAATDRLLAGLAHDEIAQRIRFASLVAAKGEAMRQHLERIVSPDPPAGDRGTQLAALLERVATPHDLIYQSASLELVARGRQVIGPVTDTLRKASEPRRRRALRQILDRLARRDALLVLECIRLLADLGNPRSNRVLLRTLLSSNPQHRIAAAMALRAIHRGGPAPSVRLWRSDPAKAAASWTRFLSKGRSAPTGPATTSLALDQQAMRKLPASIESFAAADVLSTWRFDMRGSGADWLVSVRTKAKYRVTSDSGSRLTLALDKHQQQWHHQGRADTPRSFAGRAIAFERVATGSYKVFLDDKQYARYLPLLLPLAPLVLRHLPSGQFTRGTRQALPKGFIAELVTLMSVPTSTRPKLIDHAGWIVFEKRDVRLDRYALALRLAARSADGSWERTWLSGYLSVDPVRKLPVGLALSGPTWGKTKKDHLLGELRLSWNATR